MEMPKEETHAYFKEGNYTYNYHPFYDKFKMNGYLNISFEELIFSTSKIFEEILRLNKGEESLQKTIFHATRVPSISIHKYLERIRDYAKCSEDCFVLALIYIDRVTESKKGLNPDTYSIHRLLLTSIVIAAKFNDDKFYNNEHYARVGGISLEEMNLLEKEFLYFVNFRLYVSRVVFFKYKQRISLLLSNFNKEKKESDQSN